MADHCSRSSAASIDATGVPSTSAGSIPARVAVAMTRFNEWREVRGEVHELEQKLEDRKLIERAKGLLMELDLIPEEEAFIRIRQKSMDTQRPMADIARAIILAAELTGRGRGAYAPRS